MNIFSHFLKNLQTSLHRVMLLSLVPDRLNGALKCYPHLTIKSLNFQFPFFFDFSDVTESFVVETDASGVGG